MSSKLTLVVQQFLAGLGRVLGIGTLDDGVNGARLLTEAAVDALGHVDVVARRATAAVRPLLSLDGDGLCRADGLAQLAGDAAFLARWVASQGVLATEARRDGALLEGVVDCVSARVKSAICVHVPLCLCVCAATAFLALNSPPTPYARFVPRLLNRPNIIHVPRAMKCSTMRHNSRDEVQLTVGGRTAPAGRTCLVPSRS